MAISFHLDPLDWESTYFDLDLDEVIVPIHEVAVTGLLKIHSDAEGIAQEGIRAAEVAEHEDEHQFARDLASRKLRDLPAGRRQSSQSQQESRSAGRVSWLRSCAAL